MKTLSHPNLSMDFAFDEEQGLLIITPPHDFSGNENVYHAKENLRQGLKLTDGKLKGILAHLPEHYVNAEATSYYKNHVPHVPIAMYGASFFQKLVGKFMLRLTSQNRPIRLFSGQAEAEKWLKEEMET